MLSPFAKSYMPLRHKKLVFLALIPLTLRLIVLVHPVHCDQSCVGTLLLLKQTVVNSFFHVDFLKQEVARETHWRLWGSIRSSSLTLISSLVSVTEHFEVRKSFEHFKTQFLTDCQLRFWNLQNHCSMASSAMKTRLVSLVKRRICLFGTQEGIRKAMGLQLEKAMLATAWSPAWVTSIHNEALKFVYNPQKLLAKSSAAWA